MWHIFHKWGAVGIQHLFRDSAFQCVRRYEDKLSSTPVTLAFYRCTNPKCLGVKTTELPGHWPLDELTG